MWHARHLLNRSLSLGSPTLVVSLPLEPSQVVGDSGQPDLPIRSGSAAVLIYLFRDENSRDTFAYSTDMTARSIAARIAAR
jgi:hypothetical protein